MKNLKLETGPTILLTYSKMVKHTYVLVIIFRSFSIFSFIKNVVKSIPINSSLNSEPKNAVFNHLIFLKSYILINRRYLFNTD